MAITPERLKQEIEIDPCALQLQQAYAEGNVQGVLDRLYERRLEYLPGWEGIAELLRGLGDDGKKARDALVVLLNAPSRCDQIEIVAKATVVVDGKPVPDESVMSVSDIATVMCAKPVDVDPIEEEIIKP